MSSSGHLMKRAGREFAKNVIWMAVVFGSLAAILVAATELLDAAPSPRPYLPKCPEDRSPKLMPKLRTSIVALWFVPLTTPNSGLHIR